MNKANADKSAIDNDVKTMVDAKKKSKGKIGEDQAEQSSREMRKRYEAVMDKPPTDKQKQVADDICKCLKGKPIFKTIKKAKTDKDIVSLAGENSDKEVKDLQDCYNNVMVPAVNDLGEDAGIFAMKSRTYLNKKCLDGSDKFWINIGGYLSRNAKAAEIEINMPEIEKGRDYGRLIQNQ